MIDDIIILFTNHWLLLVIFHLKTECDLLVADCNPDSIKSKTSELQLYCDLLTQQVHMIKTAAAGGKQPDIQVI